MLFAVKQPMVVLWYLERSIYFPRLFLAKFRQKFGAGFEGSENGIGKHIALSAC